MRGFLAHCKSVPKDYLEIEQSFDSVGLYLQITEKGEPKPQGVYLSPIAVEEMIEFLQEKLDEHYAEV